MSLLPNPLQHAPAHLQMGNIQENTHPSLSEYEYPPIIKYIKQW